MDDIQKTLTQQWVIDKLYVECFNYIFFVARFTVQITHEPPVQEFYPYALFFKKGTINNKQEKISMQTMCVRKQS